MALWSLLAVAMAAVALYRSWISGVRARQALATTDELITLIGQIAGETGVLPAPSARAGGGQAPAAGPDAAPGPDPAAGNAAAQASSARVQEGPPPRAAVAPQTAGTGQEALITPEMRALVPGLYGQGTPLVEIARRSGLSRGEVKMLIALDQLSRREAR